jgi:hypothetical protein
MCASLFGQGVPSPQQQQLEQPGVIDIAEDDQTADNQMDIMEDDQMVGHHPAIGQKWSDASSFELRHEYQFRIKPSKTNY